MSQNSGIQTLYTSKPKVSAASKPVSHILAQDVRPLISNKNSTPCGNDSVPNNNANACKTFPELFSIQYRSCPLCNTSLDGVPKYAPCPKCHYKGPIDECLDNLEYRDELTSDDILRNFNRFRHTRPHSAPSCANIKGNNSASGIETRDCGCINFPKSLKTCGNTKQSCVCGDLGKPQTKKPVNRIFETLRALYNPGDTKTKNRDAIGRSIRLYENRYPGIVMGHKHCRDHHKGVPEYMGWLWNTQTQGTKNYRRGWQPGAVALPVAQIMHHFLGKREEALRCKENIDCDQTCIHGRVTRMPCRCGRSKCSKKRVKRRQIQEVADRPKTTHFEFKNIPCCDDKIKFQCKKKKKCRSINAKLHSYDRHKMSSFRSLQY